jgi:hypothetical protein
VGQPGAVIIPLVVDEDLRFVLQTPKGGGMQDAVAVTLKCGAVLRFIFSETSPLAVPAADGVRCQALVFDRFQFFVV